jgi:phospholipid/cholesterol/gamma-HCH transport system substrate-binding protein
VDEITDSLAKSNFKKAIANATDILEKVDNIVTKIDNGEGTLGALINDDKLYLQIDSAAKNLNFLVDDIGQNPERYLHFSLIHINKKTSTKTKKVKKVKD